MEIVIERISNGYIVKGYAKAGKNIRDIRIIASCDQEVLTKVTEFLKLINDAVKKDPTIIC